MCRRGGCLRGARRRLGGNVSRCGDERGGGKTIIQEGCKHTNVRPVLGPGDVPIDPEPPIQTPDLATAHPLRHERLHPGPEHPAELLVRDPVEVMRQHAVLRGGGDTIPAGAHGGVGREPDGLGGAHDPPALVRREHVAQEVQVWNRRVRVVCCYWGVGG